MAASEALYRELLANVPTGVSVVTAFDAAGAPRGLTLVAFCGVSLRPPLVLVCIDLESNTLPAIRHSGGYTVNFVGSRSHHIARLMATKSETKFEGIDWSRSDVPEAGPVLHADTAAHILCRTLQEIPAGDHVVCLGEVLGGAVNQDQLPLAYHRREFVKIGER